MFALRKHCLSCNLRYDFLSYLTLPKSDIYLSRQCSYVEFTLFYNRFISGPTAQAILVEVKRGQHMWKHMRSKWGAIGNVLGEQIGKLQNAFGSWWELFENFLGTHWEQREKEKSSLPLGHFYFPLPLPKVFSALFSAPKFSPPTYLPPPFYPPT